MTPTMEVSSTPTATPNTALRPFACPACSSRFTRLENLNRHTRSVHRESNQRPFPCPHCDVSFSRSDLRKRHIKKSHHTSISSKSPPVEPLVPSIPPAEETPDQIQDAFSPHDISWLFKLPQYISAYFEKFHPTFPILHKPSIDTATTREPLLQAIACIGSVYYAPGHKFSMLLFKAGLKTLDQYTREDRSRFREIWVLQTYILFEYYAIYSCQDKLFPRALKMHRNLVDAAREYQMLQDGAALNSSSPDATMNMNDDLVTEETRWKTFIDSESQKRTMYSLYYLDSQLAITCNIRPLLSALEVKYELPCPDNRWAASNATSWSLLLQAQDPSFNMNEEDDYDGNTDPRPAHGDLYECLLHLIHPNRAMGQPLGLLWYSPFASLILIMQMQMMIRDMTMASIFFASNINLGSTRNNLSILSEENRAQIFQALHNLADLIPKLETLDLLDDTTIFGREENTPSDRGNKALWHSVWIAWHYTAITLTHQDALLTTGIVELGLPAAISTCWELGKPRAKDHRDVYNDRDFIRIVDHLEQLIALMNTPTTNSTIGDGISFRCQEDPFMTMLGFKACIMGWRVVRLMALGVDHKILTGELPINESISTSLARVVLARLMDAIDGGEQSFLVGTSSDSRYLHWAAKAFSLRDTWPTGSWMVAGFQETQREVV
ncbi:fungal-specific transcription factor domain-containing protein [Dactylonectria estremocensis]|uniref:Fungal-specific transcription factor domain-containing protein n=1 Tax=Dactylonectria estremocensis TaxID=1079267 RepID=A0A9P9J2Y8_9HYPO|nr:fungal-specific transcription factor domain-containing protein [Dactylonectria estremocensis]